MRNKLLVLGSFASLAVALPTWAAEKSGSSVSSAPATLRGTVTAAAFKMFPSPPTPNSSDATSWNCGDRKWPFFSTPKVSHGRWQGWLCRANVPLEHPSSSAKDRREVEAVDEP